MKMSTKIVLGLILVFVLGVVAFKITGSAIDEPGKYDAFAQCVSDKGAVMYGAYWCTHCQNQKEMFGKSWSYINYVECDSRGNNAQPEICEAEGIKGFPTWKFGNGEVIEGEITLRELAFRTGCELPI